MFRTLSVGSLVAALIVALPSDTATSAPVETTSAVPYLNPEDPILDLPPGAMMGAILPARATARSAPADTFLFGYVGADGFAVPGETWTFDHGHPTDPFEGWYAFDTTEQVRTWGRHVDADLWNDPANENTVPPPILSGQGSAWIGAFEIEADDLCWESGLGYGDSWCQTLASPVLEYTGTGTVDLELTYFSEIETGWDYTRVLLRLPDGSETSLNGDGFTGEIGLAPDHPASPPTGATSDASFGEAELGGPTDFQVVIRVESDGGYSDEDGRFPTSLGAFGIDDVSISGSITGGPVAYGFEADLEGWTAGECPGVGTFFGIEDVATYPALGSCDCPLNGNVLEAHTDDFDHGACHQRTYLTSNPVDLTAVLPGVERSIFADWDQYTELAGDACVYYRPGWTYYPYTCPQTGRTGWSPRVGPASYFYGVSAPGNPDCGRFRDIAGSAIPQHAEQIRFVYEVWATCGSVPGPSGESCTGETNFSPIIDNIQIGVTEALAAPSIAFDHGRELQDAFSQGQVNSPTAPGLADCARSLDGGFNPPFIGEDVTRIYGPSGDEADPWDARFHFRLRREGPGAANAAFLAYQAWKTATGVQIGDAAPFVDALMDTLEDPVPDPAFRLGYFREDDPDNPSPATELQPANEIIVDNIPPGTMIEYFVSTNYAVTPEVRFVLPDTTGGAYLEFEILPRWRDDGGVPKYPCILYVDADNLGAQAVIGTALQELGYEHDRYDYLDAGSLASHPMARGYHPASNTGATLPQLLGYRALLISSGSDRSPDPFWPEDFVLWNDWLTSSLCDGNLARRGLVANGDAIGTAIGQDSEGQTLLAARFHAATSSGSYHELTGDATDCVHLEPSALALFDTENSLGPYEYDAWGNRCPRIHHFNVLAPVGDGVGNRVYENAGTGEETSYASVAVEDLGANRNYRTSITGVSWHHMGMRDAIEDCVYDLDSRVEAARNDIASNLEWIFDGVVPGLAEDPCPAVVDVPDEDVVLAPALVTRLYANAPNPFNPRTTLRFSLAAEQQAELAIFDVSGRKVRTLVDTELEGGLHEVVWDGTDDRGHELSAGVYWSQLRTEDYEGSRKMIVLE